MRPFAEVIPGDSAYCPVRSGAPLERPKIAKLSAWLIEEGKETRGAV